MSERHVYIYDKEQGKVVPYHERTPVRKHTGVIEDTMQGLKHPATDVWTDSKSHFRRMTRDSGCYEIGNDQRPPKKYEETPGLADDMKRALYEHGLD